MPVVLDNDTPMLGTVLELDFSRVRVQGVRDEFKQGSDLRREIVLVLNVLYEPADVDAGFGGKCGHACKLYYFRTDLSHCPV